MFQCQMSYLCFFKKLSGKLLDYVKLLTFILQSKSNLVAIADIQSCNVVRSFTDPDKAT